MAEKAPAKRLLHFFSSHFFTQLSMKGGVETVARWTKKVHLPYAIQTLLICRFVQVDFFAKKFLFVPIHNKLHWSLAVICNPAAVIQPLLGTGCSAPLHEASSVKAPDGDKACILLFDSLKFHHTQTVTKLLRR